MLLLQELFQVLPESPVLQIPVLSHPHERFFYRCRIKPGIMGCAQLYGKPETDAKDLLKLDLYYIEHFSLLNDFKLVLQTAGKHIFDFLRGDL